MLKSNHTVFDIQATRQRYMKISPIRTMVQTPLLIAAHAMYVIDNLDFDQRVICLPPCTLVEAYIFMQGDRKQIEALLARKPHLQPIEDFLCNYAF